MSKIIRKIRMLDKARKNREYGIEHKSDSNEKILDKITLRVFRANHAKKNEPTRFDKFEIPVKRWTTVLDALNYAKEHYDASIGIRFSCRMAICGSCGMMINGRQRLACYTKVSEIVDNDNDTITCEPLVNFPHIRDLVTDFSQFFNQHKQMRPYIQNENADIIDKTKPSEFMQTAHDTDKYLQFSYCIKCGLCYSACPTVATDTKFPGPQALSQAYRYHADTRDIATKDRLHMVDTKHGIWRCHFAGSCSKVCPKGVDPALGIQLLRGYLMGYSKNEKKIAKLIER
jgi:succinate dehydrogenase / fumarate reductase, iron-sulfur subunit